MERSKNFNFYLPSRDVDDIADINQISQNFRTIDEQVPKKEYVDKKIDGTTGEITNINGAITQITGEISDARIDNFGNTHSSMGDSLRFMHHDLDSRKSNTDHVHNATAIRVDSHTPTLYGDSVQAALDYANQTLHEKSNKQEVANALKGTASGSEIALNDVSPVEHTMGVKVRGKNLGRFLDGYDTNGASLIGTTLVTKHGYYCALAKVSPEKSYTISKETNTSGRFRFFYYKNSPLDNPSEVSIGGVYSDRAVSYTATNLPTDTNYLLVAIGNVLENIQIELGTTVTEYTPYISDYTAVPKPYINYFFNHHCVFPSGGGETYYAPIYIDKTFEPVEGKTYYVEISDSVTTMPGYDTTGTCTATANDIGGYTMELSHTIRIETCSEGHGETWTNSFRITYLGAPDIADFNLKIGEDGYITKPVKLTKTNADGTVSEEYTPTSDGTVNGVTSLYPCTKLSTDVDGIVIECEYNRDINKAFEELQQAIISLGGTV